MAVSIHAVAFRPWCTHAQMHTCTHALHVPSCVTWMRLSRRANMPASVQMALHSAPLALFIFSATFIKSMPGGKGERGEGRGERGEGRVSTSYVPHHTSHISICPTSHSPQHTPLSKFILRLWMPMMSARLRAVGLGNSILRSMRPGRSRPGSRMSMRLVAWGRGRRAGAC